MNRSVAISLVLLLLVVGGAYLIYEKAFGETPDDSVVVVNQAKIDAGHIGATSSNHGDGGAQMRDGGVAADARDGGSVDNGPRRAEVVSVTGFVESRRGQNPDWDKVEVGQNLDEDQSIRTGRNGEARLRLSDGIEVRVSPRSEFSIRELAAGSSRVRLEVGHVSATVDEKGNEVLRVEARGTDAVAESRGGEFGMVSDGQGTVAVATTTGTVKLTAKGKAIDVTAGTSSTVQQGSEPSAPVATPSSLLLKVADPIKRQTNSTTTVIEGTTSPGALVSAQDKIVVADRNGRFKVPVALTDGPNRVAVTVIDPSGRSRDIEAPEIIVDRKKPGIETQMDWGGR